MNRNHANPTPRRRSRLTVCALLLALAGAAGCTGEPAPAVAPTEPAPSSTPAGKVDNTPKIPGGKGDLMEGIPKK